MKLIRCIQMMILLAIVAGYAGVSDGVTWWNDQWQIRKKIVFDTSAAGADIKENLNEVPVLIRLHAGNFNFAGAKPDGSDLRFVTGDDKTLLKHHLEVFDPVDGIGLVWVKVPQISAASRADFIWMYYGNKAAPATQDKGGTYDAAQALVYHLSETEGAPRDATAFGNHSSEFEGSKGLPAAIGNGIALNGAGDRIVIPKSPSLTFANGFTFSAWVRVVDAQKDAYLFSREEGDKALVIGIKDFGVYARISAGNNRILITEKLAELTPQAWHHLAVAVDQNKRLTIYVDGEEKAALERPAGIPDMAADLVIGASLAREHWVSGDLDEIQIATLARSPGWVSAAFKSQGPDSKMVVFGDEEVAGGAEDPTIRYLKVVMRAISLDGWVIIGILGVMGALSWIVFLVKAFLIQQGKKGNSVFTRSFSELEDPTNLETEAVFDQAPMYRVYAAGCEELKKWVGNPSPETKRLPQKALNSFKAALDRAFLKESQRLGSWLVVLTMSITGGPFLGLLGTVWGVMNTFAGMAEAGEANLMAIAPGVASALACTLAGLVVAIPALFSYNYLTSQIKNLNADMAVFLDQFSLKLEGTYGD